MSNLSVFILVLNWNGWKDTTECLESIQRLNYTNYSIVVIDNGSTDFSMAKIKDWAAGKLSVKSTFFAYDPTIKPVTWIEYDRATAEVGGIQEQETKIAALPANRKIILIQNGENLGFAGGNNVGIRYALKRGADYVWLLNNDTVVDRETLSKMVDLAETRADVGVVGSKLLCYNKQGVIQAAGGGKVWPWLGIARHYGEQEDDMGQWNKVIEPDYVAGASLLSKRAAIADTGLIEENYFLYWEDTDWCGRAKRKGWRLLYCPNSLVWHKENNTTGYKSPVVEYYALRNSLFYVRQFYAIYLPSAFLVQLLKLPKRIIKGQFANAKAVVEGYADFLRRKRGPYR